MKHIHCHIESRSSGSFTGTALKHIKNSFLDCEFYIEHVVEGFLKDITDIT